jgi:single-stranded-DNA-specific exonuclease
VLRDLRIDGLLMTTAATVALIEQIEDAGPFGACRPGPALCLCHVPGQRPPNRR